MADNPKIYAAMVAIMSDVTGISKAKKNMQQGFMYRGIDDVYNALHTILAKHGVFMTPEVLQVERTERQTQRGGTLLYAQARVKYTFYASDGSSVSVVVDGEGMDSGDKATGKALSIAHKYALFQTFLIPTEEQPDPDAESHQVAPAAKPAPRADKPISAAQHKKLEAALNDLGLDRESFRRWVAIHSDGELKHLNELPAALVSPLFKNDCERLKQWATVEQTIAQHNADRQRANAWMAKASHNQCQHFLDMPAAMADKLIDKLAATETTA